jgi:uncharacterized protein
MVHWWDELTFLHWRLPADEVQRLLPAGLSVELIDGSAWVGLVPFFLRVGLPRVRPVPWMSQFAETNVRTYVRDANGDIGVWFFSLDAARLGAVLVARATYRLPYYWSAMDVCHVGDTITYSTRRRWPGHRGAESAATIEIGERFDTSDLTELDHRLTARWALYSAPLTGLRRAAAHHEPWVLHRARVVDLRDELVIAAGLPQPEGPPLVHYSRSVEVRIGWPRRLAAGASR